jgi:hypothetical protein
MEYASVERFFIGVFEAFENDPRGVRSAEQQARRSSFSHSQGWKVF